MSELQHGVVRAPAESGGEWRWLFDGAGGSGDLAALRDVARKRPFHLLAPGEACLLTHVDLPLRNPRELERALPFALEDRLVEDVDTLHFAVGEAVGESGRRAVAIVARGLAQAWLEALRAVGLRPATLVPEPLALPWEAGSWTLALTDARVCLRTGAEAGAAFEATGAALWLERLLREQGAPQGLRLLGEGAGRGAIEAFAATHSLRLERLPEPFDPLAAAQAELAQGIALDFQHGALREQTRGGVRLWLAAALVATLAVGLHVGDLVLRTQQVTQLTAALEDRAGTNFRATFPHIRRVVNLRAQAEQELAALGGGGGDGTAFLTLLARSADAFATPGGPRLVTLDFRAGRLEVDVEARDMQALEACQQLLRAQGLGVDLVSADARPDGVLSRLRLSVAGT